MATFRRVAQLRTAEQFRQHLDDIGIELGFDEVVTSGAQAPLAQPYSIYGKTLTNRFAVLPMEGWDGTDDGFPSDLTLRRWQRFGRSGAKLIFGGEATAVRHDGRANPHQLMICDDAHRDAIAALRQELLNAHAELYGNSDGVVIGLQLTHSGRFCRPEQDHKLRPRVLYQHPLLDEKFNVSAENDILSDDDIRELIGRFVEAAVRAHEAGFDFVDIKHCHGYLGHEFLSAIDRSGDFGGSFENRTRFLRDIVSGIRAAVPTLKIGVRLSAWDWIPFRAGADRIGEPENWQNGDYPYAFGGSGDGMQIDLTEPYAFVDLLHELGIELVCITGGSPYYNPHLTRPAAFPPSDGYLPPEDPLIGVARHIAVTAALKKHRPELTFVGSGYSYLQDWLPNVAQYTVQHGLTDFVGIGRMVLSYPEMVADVLAGRPLQRKLICRTFSDCTTAPRNGMISGCYPLDDYYKTRPESIKVAEVKKQIKETA
ncbi:MAG: NADH:flavin oxidoreductase [Anaerolineae bacterium]|nr:NADH:flavin oxidoreductase [Anaerolineae bacterium]MCO5196023.1 NADH:flavin oxidoreductase [Anaerolineae bacterium]MCO5206837.1 NADH:flavin oxidoreductase [Anaerolineae bacterium]